MRVPMPVMNVGEVVVLVSDDSMPVQVAADHLDVVGTMVFVADVNWVCVLRSFMNVLMSMVCGTDDQHTDETQRKRDKRRDGEAIAIDRPRKQGTDERRQSKDCLTSRRPDEAGPGDPHRDR